MTDFGIARSGASQMTEAGSIVGTAQYLSPEQARGAPVDPRSDLYSLGIVIYEMLTGKVPFTGDAPVEIAMKHLSTMPEPPSKLRPEVPHDLDAVVMRALAKDPDERYASAEEMDADLARVARGARGLAADRGGDDAGAAAPTTRPPRRWSRGPRDAAAGAARLPAARRVLRGARRGARRGRGSSACSRSRSRPARGYLLYDKIQDQLDKNRPVAVSDVGQLQARAREAAARGAGLPRARDQESRAAIVESGSVISQDPAGGEPRPKGSTVTLFVSTGNPKSTVPDVAQPGADGRDHGARPRGPDGEHGATSTRTSRAARSRRRTRRRARSCRAARRCASTSRRASGWPACPSVVGEPYANAASALQGAGFTVVRVDADSSEPKGTVIAQDPVGGRERRAALEGDRHASRRAR